MGAVVLSFVTSIAGGSVLSVVELLWLNLIQDTLAALALATDPPTLALLDRKPETKKTSIITGNMWKMIIGQSVLQLVVTFVLSFAGLRIFSSWTDSELKTVVFNTFCWLQISNQVNCRRIDNKLTVFSGIHRNWLFIAITLIEIGCQIMIIYVGGAAFSITRLNGEQWAVSIILGLLSIPFGAVIRLIPIKLKLHRFRRFGRKLSGIGQELNTELEESGESVKNGNLVQAVGGEPLPVPPNLVSQPESQATAISTGEGVEQRRYHCP